MLMNRIVVAVLVFTMTSAAVGFAGLSVYLLLLPGVGAAASAALTAAFFMALLALAFGLLRRHAAVQVRPVIMTSPPNAMPEALVTSLATIARQYPLIAVACAAAMGLADTYASEKK